MYRIRRALDTPLRVFLAKALIMPIIDMYSVIYASAARANIHRLDTAYNDLMRSVCGARRSEHIRITDLYQITALEALSVRRDRALAQLMINIVSGKTVSVMWRWCVHQAHQYNTRTQNYIVPKHRTNVGAHRVCIRGLKLLNTRNS
jgi:hypothetical protein